MSINTWTLRRPDGTVLYRLDQVDGAPFEVSRLDIKGLVQCWRDDVMLWEVDGLGAHATWIWPKADPTRA